MAHPPAHHDRDRALRRLSLVTKGVAAGGGAALLVRIGAGRFARVAAFALTAVRAGAFAADAVLAAGACAGVASAIAAARPPVAITAPAATPFVTSDSRRRARSRWWAGG